MKMTCRCFHLLKRTPNMYSASEIIFSLQQEIWYVEIGYFFASRPPSFKCYKCSTSKTEIKNFMSVNLMTLWTRIIASPMPINVRISISMMFRVSNLCGILDVYKKGVCGCHPNMQLNILVTCVYHTHLLNLQGVNKTSNLWLEIFWKEAQNTNYNAKVKLTWCIIPVTTSQLVACRCANKTKLLNREIMFVFETSNT